MMERWRPVLGWENLYEVSDLGRVRSLDRIVINKAGVARRFKGQLLRPSIKKSRRGRHDAYLSDRPRQRYAPVHALVLEAFVGPRPEGLECCHFNDVQSDNRLENLRWDTREANRLDSLRNGGKACGEKHCKAKMTADSVRQARRLFDAGERTVAELAREYSISHTAMTAIARYRSHWKHV